MYREDYFYGITDLMHHNVYASLLKSHIIKEENVIIKVFKLDDEVVVIETNNFKDTILKDTRKDKNRDLMEYDLVFLKSIIFSFFQIITYFFAFFNPFKFLGR